MVQESEAGVQREAKTGGVLCTSKIIFPSFRQGINKSILDTLPSRMAKIKSLKRRQTNIGKSIKQEELLYTTNRKVNWSVTLEKYK